MLNIEDFHIKQTRSAPPHYVIFDQHELNMLDINTHTYS